MSRIYKVAKDLQKAFAESLQETPNDELRLNTMMQNVFNEKTTLESIDLFEKFKEKYESELRKRNIDALIENSDIEAYFRQTKKIEVINPEIVK